VAVFRNLGRIPSRVVRHLDGMWQGGEVPTHALTLLLPRVRHSTAVVGTPIVARRSDSCLLCRPTSPYGPMMVAVRALTDAFEIHVASPYGYPKNWDVVEYKFASVQYSMNRIDWPGYRAPIPVSFPVSQPSGVCRPAPRDPTPPEPRESGFDDANDSFLAFAASCTALSISSTFVSNTSPP